MHFSVSVDILTGWIGFYTYRGVVSVLQLFLSILIFNGLRVSWTRLFFDSSRTRLLRVSDDTLVISGLEASNEPVIETGEGTWLLKFVLSQRYVDSFSPLGLWLICRWRACRLTPIALLRKFYDTLRQLIWLTSSFSSFWKPCWTINAALPQKQLTVSPAGSVSQVCLNNAFCSSLYIVGVLRIALNAVSFCIRSASFDLDFSIISFLLRISLSRGCEISCCMTISSIERRPLRWIICVQSPLFYSVKCRTFSLSFAISDLFCAIFVSGLSPTDSELLSFTQKLLLNMYMLSISSLADIYSPSVVFPENNLVRGIFGEAGLVMCFYR